MTCHKRADLDDPAFPIAGRSFGVRSAPLWEPAENQSSTAGHLVPKGLSVNDLSQIGAKSRIE